MLISQIVNLFSISSEESGSCGAKCTHPSEHCSGSCMICLNEIHWGPKQNERIDYSCSRLIKCYIQSYTKRYYENIKFALNDIDLTNYSEFYILSLGCGASPDLMAFEELSRGKFIRYNGIDENFLWGDLQKIIIDYASQTLGLAVNFEQRDILSKTNGKATEIYNVVVLQFLISSILNDGTEEKIYKLFKTIVEQPLRRWKNADLQTPFLSLLNDVDSMNKGRNTFFHLIDFLEEAGYIGKAYAKSAHSTGDLGQNRWTRRDGQQGYGAITYEYSSDVCNNSAFLVIEVMK